MEPPFPFNFEQHDIDEVVSEAHSYWLENIFQEYSADLRDGNGPQVFRRELTATDAVVCVLFEREGVEPSPNHFKWGSYPVWPVAESRVRRRIPNYQSVMEQRCKHVRQQYAELSYAS